MYESLFLFFCRFFCRSSDNVLNNLRSQSQKYNEASMKLRRFYSRSNRARKLHIAPLINTLMRSDLWPMEWQLSAVLEEGEFEGCRGNQEEDSRKNGSEQGPEVDIGSQDWGSKAAGLYGESGGLRTRDIVSLHHLFQRTFSVLTATCLGPPVLLCVLQHIVPLWIWISLVFVCL